MSEEFVEFVYLALLDRKIVAGRPATYRGCDRILMGEWIDRQQKLKRKVIKEYLVTPMKVGDIYP